MSINERDDLVKSVEREVLAINAEHHELRSVYSVTKADVGGRSGGEELAEDVIGTITLEFGDWDKGARSTSSWRKSASGRPRFPASRSN